MSHTVKSHCCDEMNFHLEQDDLPITYDALIIEYGIKYLDGGSSVQLINYCPWCGKKLPESLRDKWFDTLHSLGIDPFVDEIPEPYNTPGWELKER